MKERAILVLKHVVKEYVRTNRPVGSGPVARWLGLSSASIRNTMSDLLKEGLLEQPHTSAGRVPTDTGYRYYVDYLLEEYRLAEAEGRAVQDCLEVLQAQLDRMLGHITEMLSEWGECLAFVAVPELEHCEVSRLELTRVSDRQALLILVLSNGLVENRLVSLPADAGRLPLRRIASRLNERLHGRPVSRVSHDFLESVFAEVRLNERHICDTIKAFFEDLLLTTARRVFVNGAEDIMGQPEFRDADTLRPLLDVMREENTDTAVFRLPRGERLPEVTIGRENALEQLSGCSVIKSHFRFGDLTTGAVGVVGPRRMQYARLCGLVDYIADSLSRAFTHYSPM